MKYSHARHAVVVILAALFLAGCVSGEVTSSLPNQSESDAGVEDVYAATDAGSDTTANDVQLVPDSDDDGDIGLQPDANLSDTTEPDGGQPDTTDPTGPDATGPDTIDPPPSWSCPEVACSAVDVTTTLGSMRDVDACAFELAFEHPISEGRALADRLLDRLENESVGAPHTFNYVSDNLNRDARSGLSGATQTRLSGLSPAGFRWNTGDENVTYWYPQGLTGSSDARDNGKVNGKRWVLSAWYHKTDARPTKGTRLALADISDPNNIKYRLMILVDPIEDSNGKAQYKEASYDSGNALHAGGIVWYGDYLFVADTAQGFRVYDMSRIFSPTEYDKDRIGIHDGESYAHGYRFAVPRIARYKWVSGSCRAKFSFLGLDRSSDPPSLVNGGYDSSSHNKKLVVWPLDPTTHLLEERGGTTQASQAAVIGQTRAQGALRVNGSFYVSSSSQDGSDGRLYKGTPGEQNTSVKWIHGAEDLYYQRDTGRIWTQGEHIGDRNIVNIPLP